MRTLLISNSGRPFLEHCKPHIRAFLRGLRRVAFVTAANLYDEEAYYQRARGALEGLPPAGAELEILHLRWDVDPLATLDKAEAIFVGGGNTYALLHRLRQASLLEHAGHGRYLSGPEQTQDGLSPQFSREPE